MFTKIFAEFTIREDAILNLWSSKSKLWIRRLIKYGLSRVGEVTEVLRSFLKSETDNTISLYQQEGRIIVAQTQSSAGLVPEDAEGADSDIDSVEEKATTLTAAQRAELAALQDLKKAIGR